MQDIEPHFKWRNSYIAAEDKRSPFYGAVYNEFAYTKKIYNYFIHPQWDDFGSPTLYTKLLFLDYEEGYAILEFIGEWNDAIQNDIMLFKRGVADLLMEEGIFKFVLICENVLNFHGSDDCYYEEWGQECREEDGWICLINVRAHLEEEMTEMLLQYHINFGAYYNEINWRPHQPQHFYKVAEALVRGEIRRLV